MSPALFGADEFGNLFGDAGSTFGDVVIDDYFPSVQVLVAFDTDPLYDGPIPWTDITARTYGFDSETGRNSELDSYDAGTLTFVVDDRDRAFDTDNPDSPYAGKLTRNRRVRINALWGTTTYPVWDGYLDSFGPFDHVTAEHKTVTLHATDGFKLLSKMALEAGRPFTIGDPVLGRLDDPTIRFGGPFEVGEQRSGVRVTEVLGFVAWPAALSDVDHGLSRLIGGTFDDKVLEYLQRVERSEYGQLFMAPDGRLTFRQRRAWTRIAEQVTSQCTFTDLPGDEDGEYTVLTVDPASTNRLRNIVKRSRDDGVGAQARSVTSIATNGPAPDEQDDLLNANRNELQDQARYVLRQFQEPVTRIDAMTVDGHGKPDVHYPQLLGRRLGDRITVARTPVEGGSTIARECFIEHISHSVSAEGRSWTTTWGLSEAEPNNFFTIGHPTLGKIDDPNVVLAF